MARRVPGSGLRAHRPRLPVAASSLYAGGHERQSEDCLGPGPARREHLDFWDAFYELRRASR